MYLMVKDVRDHFRRELREENFAVDKTGQKTIEMLGASFFADEEAIFGEPNDDYIEKEIAWYESQSTNINDIYGEEREPPAAWKYAASKHGEINSNYGYLVFSDKFYRQFDKAFIELKNNPDSRRAQMVYNRPSIWWDYKKDGMSDFICTNAQTFYIRDHQLHMVSQMRSNDVVFGYKNDRAWAIYLMEKMVGALRDWGVDVDRGDLHWQVMNLHVYERHFHLLEV